VAAQLEPEPPVHQLYRVQGRFVVVLVAATDRGHRVADRTTAPVPGHLHPSGPRASVPSREHGHRSQTGEQVEPTFLPVGRFVSLPLSAAAALPPIVHRRRTASRVLALVTVTGVREIRRDRR